MDDLISRQAALDAIKSVRIKHMAQGNDVTPIWECADEVLKVPTVELTADLSEYCDKLWKAAYERGKAEAHSRTGKWVYDEERGARGIYAICTACNEMIYQTGGFNYCPNCGARMEVEE